MSCVYYTVYNVPRCHTPYTTTRGCPAIDAKRIIFVYIFAYCVAQRKLKWWHDKVKKIMQLKVYVKPEKVDVMRQDR